MTLTSSGELSISFSHFISTIVHTTVASQSYQSACRLPFALSITQLPSSILELAWFSYRIFRRSNYFSFISPMCLSTILFVLRSFACCSYVCTWISLTHMWTMHRSMPLIRQHCFFVVSSVHLVGAFCYCLWSSLL